MTNELQIFCSLPKCEKDADAECIDCEYMVREEPKKRMTNEKAIEELSVLYERYSKASENRKHTASTGNYGMIDGQYVEALDLAIKALEQTSHLKDRPCEACEFYTEEGCSKWECVFEGSDSEWKL